MSAETVGEFVIISDHGAAFDDFYAQAYASVLNVATAILADRGAAADVTQEAFAAAHRR